jgi:hypothetical protein
MVYVSARYVFTLVCDSTIVTTFLGQCGWSRQNLHFLCGPSWNILLLSTIKNCLDVVHLMSGRVLASGQETWNIPRISPDLGFFRHVAWIGVLAVSRGQIKSLLEPGNIHRVFLDLGLLQELSMNQSSSCV